MRIEAIMLAFGEGQRRKITLPREAGKEEGEGLSIAECLELAFKFGQNDFQPRELPSVSVGDVIVLVGGDERSSTRTRYERSSTRWAVESIGFRNLNPTAFKFHVRALLKEAQAAEKSAVEQVQLARAAVKSELVCRDKQERHARTRLRVEGLKRVLDREERAELDNLQQLRRV